MLLRAVTLTVVLAARVTAPGVVDFVATARVEPTNALEGDPSDNEESVAFSVGADGLGFGIG